MTGKKVGEDGAVLEMAVGLFRENLEKQKAVRLRRAQTQSEDSGDA
jgi:hypothetical protein